MGFELQVRKVWFQMDLNKKNIYHLAEGEAQKGAGMAPGLEPSCQGPYLIFPPLSCCVLLYVSALYSGRLPSRSQVGCQQEPGPYPFLFLSIRRKRKYFPQSKVIFFSIIGLTQASNHLRTNSYKQGHSMHWLP